MREHGNTLYVTTQGAYLTRDHGTLRVKIENEVRLRVPLHHLEGVVCFGRVMVSPAVFAVCAERRLALSFLNPHGRFLARVEPPAHGNVLLRRTQYRLADDAAACLQLSRPVIAAKIQNARNLLLRSARESDAADRADRLRKAAGHMAAVLGGLAAQQTLDGARGIEGETARSYFGVFSDLLLPGDDAFALKGRSRRPPRDPVNAMLSFLYGLLRHDCASALQAVGLDPAVGFLHTDRPGRLSLALDLMEEFRTLLADRIAVALINRRQVAPGDFHTEPAGAVRLADGARRTILTAYQQRKREEVRHPLLEQTVPIGLLPHVQARLLARTLRGEMQQYPALVLR